MLKQLRIATRKSPLALWQAEHVKHCLQHHYPTLDIELVKMTTKGDKILDTPLAKIGGKGLFIKELEKGILAGEADIAVHSMKDVPAILPEGLMISTIMEREDPRDAFVSNHYNSLDDLPSHARVGTASLRRQCQIKEKYPDFEVLTLRGNVNSRLQKLDNGDFDVIILAAAGLKRLEMEDRIRCTLEPTQSLPAIGQGAVGIECGADQTEIQSLLAPLHHQPTAWRLAAERAMNAHLDGGCQVPLAGYAELKNENTQVWLRGLVGSEDGKTILRAEQTTPVEQAEQLGIDVAKALLAQGADRILQNL